MKVDIMTIAHELMHAADMDMLRLTSDLVSLEKLILVW